MSGAPSPQAQTRRKLVILLLHAVYSESAHVCLDI